MIGMLVVTHGGVARELVEAAQRIVPGCRNLAGVALAWDQSVDEVRNMIEAKVSELDEGEGVLIATDMFGGTPTNIALAFLDPGRVEVLTGVNLPMVVKFTNLPEGLGLADAAAEVAERGRGAIRVASEILARGREEDAP